jgi:hypothetical protein
VEYVDIVGSTDEIQDVVGLTYSKDYMADDRKHEFENMHKTKKIELNENDDDDDYDVEDNTNDLNQIII